MRIIYTLIALAVLSVRYTNAQCDAGVGGVYYFCDPDNPGNYFVGFTVNGVDGTFDVEDTGNSGVIALGESLIENSSMPSSNTFSGVVLTNPISLVSSTEYYFQIGPYPSDSPFSLQFSDTSDPSCNIPILSGSYNCANASSGGCNSTVPFYSIDFSNVDQKFLILGIQRQTGCCDLMGRCLEFEVVIGSGIEALEYSLLGASGGDIGFYNNENGDYDCDYETCDPTCTQITNQSMQDPLCISEPGTYIIFACKSGNNFNGVTISGIAPVDPPVFSVTEDCEVQDITISGAESITWSSEEDPNLDNLSCSTSPLNECPGPDFLYNTGVFGEVNTCGGVDFYYRVEIMPMNSVCNSTVLVDSVIARVFPAFTPTIFFTCSSLPDEYILSVAIDNGGIDCTNYSYEWLFDGSTTSNITVPGDGMTYMVVVGIDDLLFKDECRDTLTITVPSISYNVDCSLVIDTVVTCESFVPPSDNSLIMYFSACDQIPEISSSDVSDSGIGCKTNPTFIERTYTVDFDGDAMTPQDRFTCSQTISVQDTILPFFSVPPDIVINCEDMPDPTTTGDVTDAFDNCALLEVVFSDMNMAPPGCNNTRIMERTWTATDFCGNESIAVQLITVQDTTPPSFTVPADTVINCEVAPIIANTGDVIDEMDNCGTGEATFTDAPMMLTGCNGTGMISRTWTLEDACGNETVAIQLITVQDTTPPTFTVPSDTIINCEIALIIANTGDVTDEMDNCPVGQATFEDLPAMLDGCSGTGVITRTWTLTDGCGNETVAEQLITIQDTTPPTFSVPSDITIDCEVAPAIGVTGDVTDELDNCEVGEATFEDVPEMLSGCNGTGIITRTWTLTDDCGNTIMQDQLITFQDTTNPVIVTCESMITVNCDGSSDPSATGIPTANDNCTDSLDIVFTFKDDAMGGTCGDDTPIMRTWTVTDACGNTSMCMQSIIIQDIVKPTFTVPADTIINCEESLAASNTGDVSDAADNCALLEVVFSDMDRTALGCNNTRIIERTWTASDICGNDSIAIQLITVQDTTPPSFTVPAATVINCEVAPIIANTGDVIDEMDNCGTGEATFTDAPMMLTGCNGTGIISRTWTLEDACGNETVAIQLITVQDTTPPTFTVPSDTIINCEIAPIIANTGDVTDEMDNCPVGQATFEDLPAMLDGCSGTGVITRTWTLTDGCGNETVAEQLITIQDTTPPTFTAPSAVTINCDANIDDLMLTGEVSNVMDNCGVMDTMYSDDFSGQMGCNMTGEVVRSWTITDNCGNVTMLDQLITVQDTTPPTFTAPSAVTINCDADIDDLMLTGEVSNVMDNCGAMDTMYINNVSGQTGCNMTGEVVRTWTITDNCGNMTMLVQLITVQDTTPPAFTAPSAVTINCDADIDDLLLTGEVSNVMDNCSVMDTMYTDSVSGQMGCNMTGEVVRTWTITDNCGNMNMLDQMITVQDTTPPTFTVPSAVTIDCDADIDNLMLTGEVSNVVDNCGIMDTMYIDNVSGQMGCNMTGIIVRTWTVSDNCGNMTMLDQMITFQDTTPPTFTAPSAVTINCDANIDDLMLTGEVSNVMDNCGVMDTMYSDDFSGQMGCNMTGEVVRSWTITDNCGNVTMLDQLITVQDTTNPVIVTCESMIMVNCDGSSDPSATGMPTATDNCSASMDLMITFMDDAIGGTCDDDDPIMRTWTITDACGNSTQCTQAIIIQDSEKPIFTVPGDITINCEQPLDVSITGDVTDAMDNCVAPSVRFADEVEGELGCNDTGVILRTWTVSDICGNDSIDVQRITIQDIDAPSFIVPQAVTISCDDDVNDLTLTGNILNVLDNCGIMDTSYIDDISSLTGCNGTGVITRTWTITDNCDNPTSQNQLITVEDNEAPTFTAPNAVTINCEDNVDDSALVGDVTDVLDNCGVRDTSYQDDLSALTNCNGTGVITRTWTVTDNCDNQTDEFQLITIQDTTPPTFSVPANITIDCGEAISPASTGNISNEMDNCGVGNIDFVDSPMELTGCSSTGILTRTWTLEDLCGNSSSQNQIITVQDTTSPVIMVPSDVTIACEDNPENTSLTGEPSATDNCSSAEDMVFTFNDENNIDGCASSGFIIRTWTATDLCGNFATGAQRIQVEDVSPPEFTIPANITIDCFQDYTDLITTGDIAITEGTCAIGLTATFVDEVNLDGCNNTGSVTRNWTVRDNCGNMETQMQEISVVDETPPVVNCNDVTIFIEVGNNIDLQIDDIDNGSFDCGMLTRSLTQSNFTCDDAGFNMIDLLVMDECGNQGSCEASVFVIDAVAPTISCPVDQTIELGPDQCEAVATFAAPVGMDNCSFTISRVDALGLESGDDFFVGSNILTFEITDVSDNQASCSHEVFVQNFLPPAFACQGQINVSMNQNCEFEISIEDILIAEEFGCSDGYVIDIGSGTPENFQSLPSSPVITCEYLGQNLIFSIFDPTNNISCWGRVLAEDKLAPQLAGRNIDVSCETDLSPFEIGFPFNDTIEVRLENGALIAEKGADNCSEAAISYFDRTESLSCESGFSAQIIREWAAIDDGGRSASASDTINILRPVFADLILPGNIDGMENDYLKCEDRGTVWDTLPNGHPTPEVTGTVQGATCDQLFISYEDLRLNICETEPNSCFKVLRKWKILDWCSGNVTDHEQIIKILDDEAPLITAPIDKTLNTDLWCNGFIFVDAPLSIDDNCSSISSYSVFSTSGIVSYLEDEDRFTISDLEKGEVEIIYEASDCCGNFGYDTTLVTLVDVSPPVAVCHEITVVSLSVSEVDDGIGAKLYASAVDDGSNDNCNAVWFKIARMEDAPQIFNDFVPFYCENIQTENRVILRVYELDPGEGSVSSESQTEGSKLFNRFTDCMTRVEIQDKLNPILIPPTDLTVSCQYWSDEDDLNLHFGTVKVNNRMKDSLFTFDRACPGENLFDPANRYKSYDKFVGYHGFAFDVCDVSVTDTFTISYGCNSSEIIRTFTASDPNGNSSTATQRITIKECIPFYISDLTCENEDPEDGVIWPCTYITDECNSSLDTSITGVPLIRMRICNTIGIKFRDAEFTAPGDGCRSILREWRIIDKCYFDVELDDYHEKEWRYHQELRIENNAPPEFTNCDDVEVELEDNCLGLFVYNIEATDDCTDDNVLLFHYQLDVNNNGEYGDEILSRNIALELNEGIHRVRWFAFDGCANVSKCEQIVTVVDKKAPVPYCYQGLSTSLNEVGEILEFWASDFDLGGYDHCSNPVVVSFSPDTTDILFRVTCNDLSSLPQDTIPIQLWITDSAGNQDFCSSYLRITVSNQVCDDLDQLASLSGELKNHENGEKVGMVEMYLAQGANEFLMSQLSTQGDYAIEDLPMYQDYFLRPEKNDDVLNGVTTLDLVLIQKHILGTKRLVGAHHHIAADINHSGSITAGDLLDLRKVILGIKNQFSNNKSWNFIPSDHQWIDEENPWNAPDMRSFYNLSKNEQNNFIGIKIGDVNGSVLLPSAENVSARSVNSNIFNTHKTANGVNLIGGSKEEVLGFQLSFSVEKGREELVLTSELPNFSESNYHVIQGSERTSITISWTSDEGISLNDVEVFNIEGASNLRLDQEYINEVYTTTLERRNLVIENSSSFSLMQNVPNPFSAVTQINFEVKQEQAFQLSVVNINGLVIHQEKLTLKKGPHSREINLASYPTGIYLLKLASSTEQQSIKMIILR